MIVKWLMSFIAMGPFFGDASTLRHVLPSAPAPPQ